jgi:hypothetical protein
VLLFLFGRDDPTEIKVVTDNKAVYDGYSKGRRGKSGHCDDLWDIVWPLYDKIVDRGWTVILYKIKSHTDFRKMLKEEIPYDFFCANAAADKWADQAAADVQVSGEGHDFTDARAWKIQDRLVTIYQQYCDGGKPKGREDTHPTRESPISKLEKLGHIVLEEAGRRKCAICLSTWRPGREAAVIKCGRCTGLAPKIEYIGPDGTMCTIENEGLHINGRSIHGSHCITWKRGLLYCSKCGYYTTGVVRNLGLPCPMKPPNPAQGRMLTRIGKDLFPTTDGKWPLPHEVKVPSFFDIVLGGS